MSEKRSEKLLRELMALYAKYGASEFSAALAALEDGTAVEVLKRAARGRIVVAPNNTRKSVPTSNVSSQKKLQNLVVRLRKESNEKSSDIEQLLDILATKERFPTLASLRSVAAAVKVELPQRIDRTGAISLIGEKLVGMQEADVQRLTDYVKSDFRASSSLQAWSDVILKRK